MCADTPDTVETDYRDTLHLPQTEFPMRAGLPKREPGWLERWERIGVYDRLRERARNEPGRESFVLHDGPPYANGHLHIGHALNKVLKDFVVRSQQMMGRDSRYVPGWDCHGLPIEWKIEEQYRAKGRNKDEVPVVDFRQECRRFAEGWIDVQREEFKRLGVTGKWETPYLTMDFHAERVIAEEFMTFLMNGTLYQGSKPVMWSPVEKTALAEAEIEYHDKVSPAIWVKFPLVTLPSQFLESIMLIGDDEDRFPIEEVDRAVRGASVVIWTTTPWTIPQNRAVAFNSDISYGVYRVTEAAEGNWCAVGETLIVADELAEEVRQASRIDGWERLIGFNPDGATCAHPFRGLEGANGEWDYDVPLLSGEHVTVEAGTGFVHTAPSHGDDDYQLGLKYGLKMTHNVMEDGTFRADLPFFGGLEIVTAKGKDGKANGAVIDKLAEAGKLAARGKLTHSYPHSWRSKAPVIFRNTPQWFAAIDRPLGDGRYDYGRTIRERALTSIDELVTWTPRSGRNRLHSMVAGRPDWVLSRQRAWGVPLTCFVKKGAKPEDVDFLLRDERVNARVLEAFEEEGADAWYAEGAKARFLGNDHDAEAYEQVTDILDVWFDSGSTHAFVLRDREDGTEDGIADLYLEGTDQHRGWFQSSLLQACTTKGRAPYRGVLTHGFTLDAKGNKMSKSLGNTVAPDDVIKQYGADILRLWVAQADYTGDLRIGEEILKGTADSYRRLRNTMRFLLGNLAGFDAKERVEPAHMPELERWVLHRLAELDGLVREGYAAYDFQRVFQALFNFATGELSSFYFDVRKDALYCDPADGLRRRSARTVLDILFHRLTTWLAPILVFTMEEVWLERFPGDDSSVHLQDFPATPEGWRDEDLAQRWFGIRELRKHVTEALEHFRRQKEIGSSLESAPIVYLGFVHHYWPSAEAAKDNLEAVNFADVCITSSITIERGPPPEAEEDWQKDSWVRFQRASGEKCLRCWKILPDVGTHSHPGVCARCDDALG